MEQKHSIKKVSVWYLPFDSLTEIVSIVFAIPSYEEFEKYNAEQIKNWIVVIGVENNENFSIYAEEFYSNKLKGQQLLRMKDEELDVVLGQCVKPLGDRWIVKDALQSIKDTKNSGM